MKKLDRLFENSARSLAKRTSRRSLLASLGQLLTGAALMPLLPLALWAKSAERTYHASWIWVDASNGRKPLVSGDTWDVPVDYFVDPADQDGKTTLTLWGAGPWIDTPDGVK